MATDETPIVLSRKAEQELRAMAVFTGFTFEEILEDFRACHWIVPAGSVDLAIFRCSADYPERRAAVESPSGHLEDILYACMNARLHAMGLSKHTKKGW